MGPNNWYFILFSQEVPSDWFKPSQIKGLTVAILEGPCGHLWQTKVHFSDKLTFFTEGWENLSLITGYSFKILLFLGTWMMHTFLCKYLT